MKDLSPKKNTKKEYKIEAEALQIAQLSLSKAISVIERLCLHTFIFIAISSPQVAL